MNVASRPSQCFVCFLLIALSFSSCTGPEENPRRTDNFNAGWKFTLDTSGLSDPGLNDPGLNDPGLSDPGLNDPGLSDPGLNDAHWRELDLPHDWSIEGTFSPNHPATVGGGALPGGTGWYRKHFTLPVEDSSKKIFIHFGGVYWNSEVYINGHMLGWRPNGYISFRYDMSPYLHFGGENNVIAVKVDNSSQPNSRWYSGSGIYRNVWLIRTSPVYVEQWGTYVTTPVVEHNRAVVVAEVDLMNGGDEEQEIRATGKIHSPTGVKVGEVTREISIAPSGKERVRMEFTIDDPVLWSVDAPNLYQFEVTLAEEGALLDQTVTDFGIRTFRFDSEQGFFLNDQPLKILGVCNHHDLGCLGAAVNRRAVERQLELLKEMGCNAIRTAHNPPAPELLELCDKMGFLVMDETFDMWKKNKSPHDYSQYWDEWHARDLRDHILRDRNHASVFLWSIGNEILEQWDSTGTAITKELAAIVRDLDTTRHIVTGNNWPHPENALLKAGEMDLIGYNYKHREFEEFPERFSGKCFIATETTSGLMTRGHYDMPSDSIRRWPVRWDKPFTGGNPDHTVSAYDNVSTPWGSTHEEAWSLIKKHDYLSGMFVWTGFDYLGEPTPYGWPSRSSYFGIIDLAGFPKDVYYMYKSEWTDTPVLHLFPHWNWKEGEEVDVIAYTSCDSVELFQDGVSMGWRTNSDTVLHLSWRLTFAPGELKAVGVLPSGEQLEASVRTAGAPATLEVIADRSVITADGEDLSFITVNVLDARGIPVPHADNMVTCQVEGDARVIGTDNGSQVSHEPFTTNYRKAFNGKCLFVVQAGRHDGEAGLTFTAEGLEGANVKLEMKQP
jgi:beta-galactosidase